MPTKLSSKESAVDSINTTWKTIQENLRENCEEDAQVSVVKPTKGILSSRRVEMQFAIKSLRYCLSGKGKRKNYNFS